MQSKLLLLSLVFAPMLGQSALANALTLEELLSKLAESNKRRDALLVGYEGIRVYEASNALTHSHARMQVKVVFHNPSGKDFTVVSEDGSRVIRSRVFKPALSAEREALRPDLKQRNAINPENYEFALAGEEDLRGRHCYVLEAHPRRKDKFLLRGRVWIDSVDYAVARVQGELVKLPSFWTRKVEYARDYQKVGEFWLPMRDESVSQLLIFGRSNMSIIYSDYQVQSKSADGVPGGEAQSFKQR